MPPDSSTPDGQRELDIARGTTIDAAFHGAAFALRFRDEWDGCYTGLEFSPDDARWLRDRLDAFLRGHELRSNPELQRQVSSFQEDVQFLVDHGYSYQQAFEFVVADRERIYGKVLS